MQSDLPSVSTDHAPDKSVRILILEHDPNDLELLRYELSKTGIPHSICVVSTEKAFEKAILDFLPEVILSDFSLPTFDGTKAFKIRQALAPETPFIFVSSYIGEDNSIEMIKTGLTDYVRKDKLSLLKFKLERALEDSREQKARKLAEERLCVNETMLNESQELARLGSWEKNLVTGAYTWSDQFCRILRIPAGASLSPDLYFSAIHPEELDYIRAKVQNSELFLIDISYEHRLLHANGEITFVHCEIRNEVNSEGQLIRRFGIMQDITERKLSEQQKELDFNHMKAIINNTRDLMWSLGLDYKLITSNQAFDKSVIKATGQLAQKGHNLLQLGFYEEVNKRYKGYYDRAFAGEIFTVMEHSDIPEEAWAEISFYPIRSGNGIAGVTCYSRDITERKRFERELEKKYAGPEV